MKINFQNKKKLQMMIFVFIAVITLGVGYAAISAVNLIVNSNATASANQNNFSVVFKSASVTTGTGSATIDQNDSTQAYFDVSGLSKTGDTAVATYTIKNESNGVGAEIDLKVTNTNTEYFQVTESIEDNKLQAGDSTTATVTVEMIKTPITSNVTTSITGTLTAIPLENMSAIGGTLVVATPIPDPVSFSTDSWATIQRAVQDNNTSIYNVGDTKIVSINNINYTVRLVNKTTGEHCGDNDTEYSQTACGFVVEFADVVSRRYMNSSQSNVGGWEDCAMRTYLNGNFYDNLPNDLKNIIMDTRTISGHGSSDLSSFTTTDKLYLLSGVEIYGSDKNDTAASKTHQLEYYSINNVTESSNNSYAIKQYNGSNNWYWLRTAVSGNIYFRYVNSDGYLRAVSAGSVTTGLAPAFRIG